MFYICVMVSKSHKDTKAIESDPTNMHCLSI